LSILHTMFHSKTLDTRVDHDFLPAPTAPETTPARREPRQRVAMLVALALLIVALGVVIYRDRDFWFPDTQESEDQLEPVPVIATPPQQVAKAVVEQPAAQQPSATASKTATPETKPLITKPKVKPSPAAASAMKAASAPVAGSGPAPSAKASASAVASSTPPSAPAASSAAAASAAPSSTPLTASGQPANATATRTVLPPLEVEVVAGDNHSTVRPGTNSVHVDLKPGSPPKPVTDASMAGNAPATAASVTTSATERVQMSAGAAEVVGQPVQPGYPMLARQMKVQGSVLLQALIGRDGSIQDLHVLTGPAILANAAQEAVRQWRFKPHYVGNEAVETQARITVNFTISTN